MCNSFHLTPSALTSTIAADLYFGDGNFDNFQLKDQGGSNFAAGNSFSPSCSSASRLYHLGYNSASTGSGSSCTYYYEGTNYPSCIYNSSGSGFQMNLQHEIFNNNACNVSSHCSMFNTGENENFTYQMDSTKFTEDSIEVPWLGIEITDDLFEKDNEDIYTGIDKYITEDNAMTIFPNPSDGHFYIGLKDADIGKPITFNVYDLKGQLVYSTHFIQSDSKITVNLCDLHKGIYLYKAFNEEDSKISSGKLFINY
jgi:hypothetical protein